MNKELLDQNIAIAEHISSLLCEEIGLELEYPTSESFDVIENCERQLVNLSGWVKDLKHLFNIELIFGSKSLHLQS